MWKGYVLLSFRPPPKLTMTTVAETNVVKRSPMDNMAVETIKNDRLVIKKKQTKDQEGLPKMQKVWSVFLVEYSPGLFRENVEISRSKDKLRTL